MEFAATTRTAASNAASAEISVCSQFGKITKSIVRARAKMGWQAYHVYTSLLTFRSNDTGLARVAIDTLASETGIDRRHVQRSIAKLVSLGLVSLVGTYGEKGINVWSIALEMPTDRKPKNSIVNGHFVEPMASPAMARRATHSEVSSFREKEQPQPTTVRLAEPSRAVVVLSPSAETAKAKTAIMQEAPQAALPVPQPIAKPVQTNASTARLAPTVGIVNGGTVQAVKPGKPAKVEAIKQPPAPKAEPIHPASFHHALTRAEATTIMTLLAVLPTDVQTAVLAEFVAQLDGGGIHRPVGYARRLVEVAKAGTFVPSASREAAQRVEVEQAEATRKKAQEEEEREKQAQAATDAAKLDSILGGLPPERLADMRQAFIRGLPKFQRKLFESTDFDSPGFDAVFREHLRETLNI